MCQFRFNTLWFFGTYENLITAFDGWEYLTTYRMWVKILLTILTTWLWWSCRCVSCNARGKTCWWRRYWTWTWSWARSVSPGSDRSLERSMCECSTHVVEPDIWIKPPGPSCSQKSHRCKAWNKQHVLGWNQAKFTYLTAGSWIIFLLWFYVGDVVEVLSNYISSPGCLLLQ